MTLKEEEMVSLDRMIQKVKELNDESESFWFRRQVLRDLLSEGKEGRWVKVMKLLITDNDDPRITFSYVLEKLRKLRMLLPRNLEYQILYYPKQQTYKRWFKEKYA